MERENKGWWSKRFREECRRPLAAVSETFWMSTKYRDEMKPKVCMERAKLLITVEHLLRK